ncbi:MAG: hypothetical protein ACR2LE_10520 [Nocardioidaceae bacterium]
MTPDPVGTLAEEAAKLIAVVQSWGQSASGMGNESHGGPADEGEPADDDRAAAEPSEHAHSTSECRFCPLCSTVRLARAATPDVRAHVGNAVLSLSMAVSELLDNVRNDESGRPSVEDVDLAED